MQNSSSIIFIVRKNSKNLCTTSHCWITRQWPITNRILKRLQTNNEFRSMSPAAQVGYLTPRRQRRRGSVERPCLHADRTLVATDRTPPATDVDAARSPAAAEAGGKVWSSVGVLQAGHRCARIRRCQRRRHGADGGGGGIGGGVVERSWSAAPWGTASS